MKLIDEIVEVLEEKKKDSKYFDVSEKTINEFFDFEVQKQKSDINSTDISVKSGYRQAESVSGNINEMNMDHLRQFVLSCKECKLCNTRTHVVFGEGTPSADIMFIGEAPGQEEDRQGKPFVGKSGQLLTKMIQAMGYSREDVYIANIIKCRPPYNRNPSPEEAKCCLIFLNRQIELIKPKVIVLLGAVPLHVLLGLNGITRIHGQWKEYNGIKTMPTFHPAFLLRDPNRKRPAWEDLKKIMKFLGKK
ncbi:MAG: uracil-DNA glycosylase [Victivallales bacterium]|nr:uracil-DNA glycosylase [Victivallales bacterium]